MIVDDLHRRYAAIKRRTDALPDFPSEDLQRSRRLFEMIADQPQPQPRRFEVWTFCAGLPIPEELQSKFAQIRNIVDVELPSSVARYWVPLDRLQWEVLTVKWPDEDLEPSLLTSAPALVRDVLARMEPLTLDFRGFLISTEGTLIGRGFGSIHELKDAMVHGIPFASARQSRIGHISLGRVLSPVGPAVFSRLREVVDSSLDIRFGSLLVSQIKYVHEKRWYMGEVDVIETLSLGCRL